MPTALEPTCGRCGRPHAEGDVACALCGNLFVPASSRTRTTPGDPQFDVAQAQLAGAAVHVRASAARTDPTVEERFEEPRVLGLPEPWFYLTLGLVTAPLFSVTPLVRLIGWFLSALVHEMGHSLVAWTFGMPSFPALSLTAEAVAIHGEQSVPLVLLILAGAVFAAWRIPRRGVRWAVLPLVAIVYPALAFTDAREALHLVGGHLGELAFATLCLQRALSGGFTESAVERGLYGTVGWYLVGANLLLTVGLVTSASSQASYASNGSFGLTNDYLRLAEDVLGLPLEAVAIGMSLVALAAPVVGLVWWRWAARR